MQDMLSIALTAHFGRPSQPDTSTFFSSFVKGLQDCRAATNRDLVTGTSIPNAEHDSWVGALGYLAILDQIGNCFRLQSRAESNAIVENPIVSALRNFTDLSADEIAALYALRCAFAHDFSLFNVHPTKPELTHCFRLHATAEEGLVKLPAARWSGDYAHRPPECWTSIDLALLGDLVEDICARLPQMARAGAISIKLAGGPTELIDRYGVMKNPPTPA